jgi:hypothetical protein
MGIAVSIPGLRTYISRSAGGGEGRRGRCLELRPNIHEMNCSAHFGRYSPRPSGSSIWRSSRRNTFARGPLTHGTCVQTGADTGSSPTRPTSTRTNTSLASTSPYPFTLASRSASTRGSRPLYPRHSGADWRQPGGRGTKRLPLWTKPTRPRSSSQSVSVVEIPSWTSPQLRPTRRWSRTGKRLHSGVTSSRGRTAA